MSPRRRRRRRAQSLEALMCGRFGLQQTGRALATQLLADLGVQAIDASVPQELRPRYNIAPSQDVLAALTRTVGNTPDREPERRLEMLRWGLIPSWAKDPNAVRSTINARAETVATSPVFRSAWAAGRRCLVPADVFYEWADAEAPEADPRNGDLGRRPARRTPRARRQPYAIRLRDGSPFCFAGLWEPWRDRRAAAGAPWVATCTLLTTRPNALVAGIHNRMPVILPREAYGFWLDPDTPAEMAAEVLDPYPAEAMEAVPITTYVNDPRHDDPGVLTPARPA